MQVGNPGRGIGVAGADQRVQDRQNRRRLGSSGIARGGGEPPEGSRQGGPGPGGGGLGGLRPAARRKVLAGSHGGEDAAGVDGANALVQAQQPVPGEVVGGIGQDPGGREVVLDVRGVGEPQPAEFDVRDLAGVELDFQEVAVMRGADQHRLIPQRRAVLMRVQHPGADLPRLGGLVVAADQQRRHPGAAVAGQRQLQARHRRSDEVRQVKDALPGPVVAVQADDVQSRVVGGELPQVRRVSATEPIDGLRVVAHAGQLLPVGLQ